jgi:hypothetical protein
VALLFAACGFGVTTAATNIDATSATLTGDVRNTVAAPTDYWFEWGTTTSYGSTTPTGSVNVVDFTQPYPVTADLSGLVSGTTYHYRLCVLDAQGGVCGNDRAFTASPGDSVSGFGLVYSIPGLGASLGADVSAASAADGSNPTGQAISTPGSWFFRIADRGPVTCLNVSGNRAAVGFMALAPDIGEPDPTPFPILFFIEDNGPTGDRFSFGTIAAPATDCPVPTNADFVPSTLGGSPVGPGLESGNFTVVDRPIVP